MKISDYRAGDMVEWVSELDPMVGTVELVGKYGVHGDGEDYLHVVWRDGGESILVTKHIGKIKRGEAESGIEVEGGGEKSIEQIKADKEFLYQENRRLRGELAEANELLDFYKYGTKIELVESLQARITALEANQHHEDCDTRDIMIQGKPCNCYVLLKAEIERLRAEPAEMIELSERDLLNELNRQEGLNLKNHVSSSILERNRAIIRDFVGTAFQYLRRKAS
jgi:hypothetical protein